MQRLLGSFRWTSGDILRHGNGWGMGGGKTNKTKKVDGSGKNPEGGGGYCHIGAIYVCAAVKGMVFKKFTLG